MLSRRGFTVLGWVLPTWFCASAHPTSASGATLILQIPILSSVNIAAPPVPWADLENWSGVQGISYSPESSNPYTLDVFADFASLSAATVAQQSSISGLVFDGLKPILNGTIASYVVQFDQASPLQTLNTVANTELAIFYLLPNSNEKKATTTFDTAFATLKSAVESASGEVFATSGWDVTSAVNPATGQTVQTYVALVGWNSLASHQAFDGTAAFGGAITGLLPLLSGSEDSDDKLIPVVSPPAPPAC